MESKAVSAANSQLSSASTASSLRQKPEAQASAKVGVTEKAAATSGASSVESGASAELATTQTVQDSKPTVNISGQTIGSTINTTA